MKKRMLLAAILLFGLSLFSGCGKSDKNLLPGRDGIRMNDGETVFLKEVDSEDYFAANFFVSQNGAKANGRADDSDAIQKTLDKAAQAGGGTVYLPCGTYKVKKPLTVPDNVILKGDFTPPTAKNPSGLKTEILLADSEALRQTPAFSLGNNAGLSGLSIRYEKQASDDIKEYPFTVIQDHSESVRITDLELVNSYQGIRIGEEACGEILLENLYITALKTGIRVEHNSDSIRLEKIIVSQRYWSNAKKEKNETYNADKVSDYIGENLTAVSFGNVGSTLVDHLEIDAANRGIHTEIPQESQSMLSVTALSANSVKKVFEIDSLGQGGMTVAASTLQTTGLIDSNIVKANENFKTQICFNACSFPSQTYEAFVSAGNGDIALSNCTFSSWRKGLFYMTDGVAAAVSNTFSDRQIVGIFENPALAIFYNNTFPDIAYANADYFFEQSGQTDYALTPIQGSDFDFYDPAEVKSAATVYADDFGMSTEAETNNLALQEAINALGNAGGTVFIREGEYRFDRTLITLKPNVALCGVGQGNSGSYATVFTFAGVNGEKSAAIAAEKNTRISGIQFFCTDTSDADGYPDYAVRASGSAGFQIRNTQISGFAGGVYLENVSDATINNCSVKTSVYGAALINTSDVLINNCRFLPIEEENQRAQQKQTLTAILLNGSKHTALSANTISCASAGLVMQAPAGTEDGTPNIISSGLLISDTTRAVQIDGTDYAVLCGTMLSPAENGSYIAASKDNAGKTVIANTVFAGPINAETYITAGAGNTELQTSVLRGTVKSALAVSGGTLTAGANLFYTIPETHILADGGKTVLIGNLIESEKEFAAIEGNYVTENLSAGAEADSLYNAKRCDIPENLEASEIQ